MSSGRKKDSKSRPPENGGAPGSPPRSPAAFPSWAPADDLWAESGPSLLGTTVGTIRIVDFIGKGGMGEVYAGYDEKLKRKVALKALRSDIRHQPEARSRFLHEARILSQLEHPNICRIYDLIEGEERDFLVMEFITGTSLTKIIKKRASRALQFKVAQSVAGVLAVAHDKGIVHRDLKPENVLITAEEEVKVLDFGLAQSLVDPTAETIDSAKNAIGRAGAAVIPPVKAPEAGVPSGSSQVMGTLGFMSPEQVRGETATAATDMFTFGLMLQELFSGQPPVAPELSTQELLVWAATGETRPFVDRDKDLVALVNRLKSHAPASRPSALDVAERLLWISQKPKRRRLRLLAVAVAVVLVASTLIAIVQGVKAHRAALRAEAEARTAKQIAAFLKGMYEASDPTTRPDARSITVSEILQEGSKKIESDLAGQPLVQAGLMTTIGEVYMQFAAYDEAESLLRKALTLRENTPGAAGRDLAETLRSLADVLRRKGDLDGAAPLIQRALDLHQKELGPNDPEVATDLNVLALILAGQGDASASLAAFERALKIEERARGPNSQEVAAVLNGLAATLAGKGENERAKGLYERALRIDEKRLNPGNPALATDLGNLAALLVAMGDLKGAKPLYERAIEIETQALGPEHPSVAISLNNLASMLQDQGDLSGAKAQYERALAIHEKALGPDHPDVAIDLNNIASLQYAQGDYLGARASYERALAIDERALPPDHPLLAVVLYSLARSLNKLGDFKAAKPYCERAVALLDQRVQKDPKDSISRVRLGKSYLILGSIECGLRGAKAGQAAYAKAQQTVQPLLGPSAPLKALDVYAQALLLQGRTDEARPVIQQLQNKHWSGSELPELSRKAGLTH
jgi:tetratricopeptide (TPR) repeat protein/tRNA A-37 threonylcarbamoyl transferase component Bud32